jgi:plasmid stabilization system protein ParE
LAFSVRISSDALADAEEYATYVRDVKGDPSAASRWFAGLIETIDSLAFFPERCSVIVERVGARRYRQLLYFSHRIVFRVDREARVVYVARVYHAARRPLRKADLT